MCLSVASDTVISVSFELEVPSCVFTVFTITMKYLIVFALIAFASAKPQQIGFQYLDDAIRQAQSENNFESDAVVIDVSLVN